MIGDHQALPNFETILRRLGADPGRCGRTRCPLHGGSNPSAFSYNEDKGVFNCFSCGERGDKIDLICAVLRTDFNRALRFLGLEPGRPPEPDAELECLREIRSGLRVWQRHLVRKLRDELLLRNRIHLMAEKLLKKDRDSEAGWILMRDAFYGQAEIEWACDLVDLARTDEERLTAYLLMETS